ncbi:Fatty acid desaturase domain [Trinorchestia longiramus]|nr:Fatty acid desaturase domain [Trinorchestia longiramus]
MGQHVSRTDFEYTELEQIHAVRRREILKKHPEVKTLFGPDPMLGVWVVLIVLFQVASLFFVYHMHWVPFLLMSYCVGGTLNHSLTLAIHEIGHNLVFGHRYPLANRIVGMIANLPIGLPMSVTFRIYHIGHHKDQGVPEIDTDIPTRLEAKLFCTTFGKIIWMMLQPFFYAFRPLAVHPRIFTPMELVNIIVQLTFNAAVIYYFDFRTFLYLIGGSVMAMGLHPLAGHFIAEHYMFNKGQETYSYYGPFNWVSFNSGYHNEHHDFPYVAFSRLPKLRAMLPEYYDTLPRHESWMKVLYDFITDPAIGPYARVVREKHLKSLAERQRAADAAVSSSDVETRTPHRHVGPGDGDIDPCNGDISTSNGCITTHNGDIGRNKDSCIPEDDFKKHHSDNLQVNNIDGSSHDEHEKPDPIETSVHSREACRESSLLTRRTVPTLKV